MNLDVALEAELSTGPPDLPGDPPEAEGLVAEYTVTNNTDTPILVAERRADVKVQDIGRPVPADEETAWVYATEDGVVQLTKELFHVVDDRERGEPYLVSARRVQPGESITGRAFALMPLQGIVPQSDIFDVPGSADLPADATTWRFCVQIAPDPENRDEAIIYDYMPDRQLLCSDDADLPPGALGGE